MNMIRLPLLVGFSLLSLLVASRPLLAQAPPAIQIFMPGGVLPTREVRFWLMRSQNTAVILLTDKKGTYQFTPELIDTDEYTVIVDTDKRNFETTRHRFRLSPATVCIPVFLIPMQAKPAPARPLSLAENDAKASPEARAAYETALQEVAAERTTQAINEFARALTLHPQYLRALNELGLLYLKLNHLDEAAAVFTQAISFNSSYHLPRLNLGMVRNRQGRFGDAVATLYELVKEQPTLGQARILLAEGLLISKQYDEAESQLREGLKDKTLDRSLRADAHVKLGRVLASQERHGIAAVEMEKAVELEPESPSTQLYLGAAYVQLNKQVEAETALQKAYTLGGKRAATAQLLLGQLYYNQQKFDLALRAFEQFLADMPTANNAPQIKEIVAKIKAMLKK